MTASPLRIAYLVTRPIPSRETDTQQVVSTVDALGGVGVDVELVVPGRRGERGSDREFEASLRAFYDVHHPFRIRRRWTVEPSTLQLERPLHALVAVLRQDRGIDLVHTRSRGVVTLCTALRIPVVFETYRRLGQTAPRFAALLARLSRSPWLLGIVTHSHASADSLVGAGVARGRIAVLHNGHDPRKLEPRLDREAARAQLGLASTARIALYTGNVQANKGLDTLLDLAARVPEATVLIVGGKDRDVEALRDEVRRRGLANVDCPGWRPAAELAPYYHAADVLLIPPTGKPLLEHGQTVLPMKVFPYLAAGRPILAPALPDIGEVLHHDRNAWLVPPDDAVAAADGLRRLLGDASLAARLASAALETSAGLTWDARATALVAHYRDWLAALDRARPGRPQRAPV